MFITFEGGDGAGKTTQIELLKEALEKEGRSVVVTREPGGNAVAEKIRELLLDRASVMEDMTEAYLYAAARAEHVRAVILPALARGQVVLCDRFIDSSVAYQGAGRQLGMEQIAALNAMAVGETRPDITVYLRMSADVALSRRLSASKPDRLEQQKADFFSRTYQAYERLFAGQEKRVLTVNAAQSIEQVTRKMLDGLDERLDGLEV